MKYILLLLLITSKCYSQSTGGGFPPAANPMSGGSAGQKFMKNSNANNDWAWSTDFGSTSIITVGTIGTGTWQASIIAPAYLGTGSSITTKYLRGDGTWQTIAGGGDLLSTNNLSELTNFATARTNLGLVIGTNVLAPNGNGSALTGLTASQVSLGNVTNESKATMFTSPTFTGTPVVPGYLPNTTTSGVGASPTASGTVTVTHGLGRIPTTIDIKSISSFTSNAAATPVPFSEGTFNSTGNRCLYMVINGTTTQVSQTSTVFSIIMVTSAGNQITGVIGNVGATTFDIVFTETGTHTAGNYLWKAQ